MQYISTRGTAPPHNFAQVTLTGLATDRGLYLPKAYRRFTTAEMRVLAKLDYPQLATRVIARFTDSSLPDAELERLCHHAYANFSHPEVAPLRRLDDSLYLLELFHGPTLAFKDFGLQFLGPLFGYFLTRRGQTCTIIGATSGDTGSAAIAAVRGLDCVRLFMLHPRGRVSEVQRRQMTTVQDDNIHNLAVDGVFDDCQNLVKAMFAHAEFRQRHALGAVNSINWSRIAAQVVYYFYAALRIGAPQRAVNFAVPTGNFGNVFAGFVARQLGLPINRLIVGSNRNDILSLFFASGRMTRRPVTPTISPSMDIAISSNFERYLFELLGRDGVATAALMQQFADTGAFSLSDAARRQTTELFAAARFDDAQTGAEIQRVYAKNALILDPHTAVGVAAARQCAQKGVPTVALATAHPAKFADSVRAALATDDPNADPAIPMPKSLQNILQLEEKFTRIANDFDAVTAFIDAAPPPCA